MPVDPSMTEHRLIVAGGRDFTNARLLERTVNDYADALGPAVGVSIVSGLARGADRLAYEMARRRHIQCYAFPAHWDEHGRRAGFIRNDEMACFADALIAFWDGVSRGTAHRIRTMDALGKPVTVVRYGQTEQH